FTGLASNRYGNAHPNIVPYQTLAARDGRFALALGNDGQWTALCRELGRTDLASRSDYSTNAGRVKRRAELIPELERSFSTLGVDEAVAACARAGVPAGPVRSVTEAFADPQTTARGMIVELDRGDGTPIRMVGSPLALTSTPPSYRLPPPRLGEHTEEVLREIGLEWDDQSRDP
ncbi:MAG: CoA transferase, partial [Acidobacteria bacterium]|nr:CoA transferase [Acidobacteriota bacterium]